MIPADSLIGRMTADADTDRANFAYGTATFVDADGVITHVSVPPDRVVEAVDRVSKRMGVYEAYVPGPKARARR